MTSPLPDTAGLGDTGHVVDHNLLTAALDEMQDVVAAKLDSTTASATYVTSEPAAVTLVIDPEFGYDPAPGEVVISSEQDGVPADEAGQVSAVLSKVSADPRDYAWVPLPTGTGSALTVQDEGSSLATAATTLNFVGAGVTATGTGASKTITIPGGSGTAKTYYTYDARDYGTLVNDGTGDNSAVIQAAVNAAHAGRAVTGPSQVYLPGGRYRLNTKITWRTHVGLVGEGMERTVLLPFGNQTAIEAKGTPSEPLTDCHFRDFGIDGINQSNATYTTGIKGIFIQHMLRPRWERMAIRNTWGTGFGVDFLRDYIFHGCIATGNGRGIAATGSDPANSLGGSGFGIGTGGTLDEQGVILGCTATNNGVHGIFFEQQTVTTTIDGPFLSRGHRVIGCFSSGNRLGYRDSGTDGTLVTGNVFAGNNYAGIALDKTTLSPSVSINPRITGNIIARNGAGETSGGGVVLGRIGSGALIRDNDILTNTGFGVRGLVTASTTDIGAGLSVSGNRIRANTRAGIFFGLATGLTLTDAIVTGNTVQDNGTDTGQTIRAGISVDTSTLRLRITGNTVFDSQTTKTQQGGIELTSARTSTDAVIRDNDLRENAAGATYVTAHTMAGTSFVDGNIGFQPLHPESGGGGGGGTGLLAVRKVAGSTVVSSTNSADLDSTGLTASVTVPASGQLVVVLSATAFLASTDTPNGGQWDVRDATTFLTAAATVTTTTARLGVSQVFLLTGLTAGATQVVRFGAKKGSQDMTVIDPTMLVWSV